MLTRRRSSPSSARCRACEHAELVPAAESAKRLQSALGADSALLDGVELGSLPPTVEVALQPGMRDVIALSPTVTRSRARTASTT